MLLIDVTIVLEKHSINNYNVKILQCLIFTMPKYDFNQDYQDWLLIETLYLCM